jgi:hypothetical protein
VLLVSHALERNKCTSPKTKGDGAEIVGLVVKNGNILVADKVYTVGVKLAGPINADIVITYVLF